MLDTVRKVSTRQSKIDFDSYVVSKWKELIWLFRGQARLGSGLEIARATLKLETSL